MPNHVQTKLIFDGSNEDIKKINELLRETVIEDGREYELFDFRKIVPYPSREECPKEYLVDESFNEKTDYGITNTKAHISIDENAPYLDWYRWQIDNWDTKWNAYEVQWISDSEVWFQTAWSFCGKVIEKLSQMFPDVTIEFKYADEDIGCNCDYGWASNGKITYAGLTGPAATKFAIELWGCEDDYEFKDGEWVYRDFE